MLNQDASRALKAEDIEDIKDVIVTSARLYSDHTAFYQKLEKTGEYNRTTYREMLEMVNGLGTALIRSGRRDKRIAIVGDSCIQWAVSYLAVLCGTGTAVLLDKDLTSKEMEKRILQTDVSCVIFSAKYRSLFETIRENTGQQLQLLIDMDAAEDKDFILAWKPFVLKGLRAAVHGDHEFLDAQIERESAGMILFTPDESGKPEEVILSHCQLAEYLADSSASQKIDNEDIFFSMLPMHGLHGSISGLLTPLYKGAALAYFGETGTDIENLKEPLEEIGPTVLLGTPQNLEDIYKKIWENIENKGKGMLIKAAIKGNKMASRFGMSLGEGLFQEIRAILGGKMRLMIYSSPDVDPAILDGIQDFGIEVQQACSFSDTDCLATDCLATDCPDTY